MSELKLNAKVRTEFGKGAARKIRREDMVPAVIYGHGMDPVHVSLPGHDTMMALKNPNALIKVSVDDGTEHLTFVKAHQREVIRRFIEHVDLLVVRKGEKIEVDIPVVTVGDSAPGTIVTVESMTVLLKVEATHIPEQIEVSVDGKEAGTTITAADLDLPGEAELAVDADTAVVNVAEPVAADLPDTDVSDDTSAGAVTETAVGDNGGSNEAKS